MSVASKALPNIMNLNHSKLNSMFKRPMLLLLILGLSLLGSALAVIYVKQLDRQLFINTQVLEMQKDHLNTEWGQLLLEESTWSTQARIQAIAQQQLGMALPQQNAIQIIKIN